MIITATAREGEANGRPPTPWRRWLRPLISMGVLGGVFVAGAKFSTVPWHIRHSLKTAAAVAPDYLAAEATRARAIIGSEPLPVVTLEVKFKYMAKIRVQREQALADGWIRTTDADFVPAKLTLDGKSIPVEVRLKGDRAAHLEGNKWSFRVKVKGDERPFGMRTFSLQHPGVRNFLNEWAFLEDVRRQGILAVRYRFVRFVVNGEDKGIYALEEHFSKELLESHGRPEGVIVAFEEQPSVHYDLSFQQYEGRVGTDVATRMSAVESQEVRTYDTAHVKETPALSAMSDQAIDMLRAFQEGRRPASDVFDVELMGRFLAIVDLWDAKHQILWQNTRYYYNPTTSRLEPIAFDAMALAGRADMPLVATDLNNAYVNGPLRDPAIARVYLRELERVSAPAYVEKAREVIEPAFMRWRLVLQTEWPMGTAMSARWTNELHGWPRPPSLIEPPWGKLAARQVFIRSAIRPERMLIAAAVQAPSVSSEKNPSATYTLDVRSIAMLPVEIVGFRVDGGAVIPAASVWSQRYPIGVWQNPNGTVTVVPDQLPYSQDNPPTIATFRLVVKNPPQHLRGKSLGGQDPRKGGLLPVAAEGSETESQQGVKKQATGWAPTIEVISQFPGQSYQSVTVARVAQQETSHEDTEAQTTGNDEKGKPAARGT